MGDWSRRAQPSGDHETTRSLRSDFQEAPGEAEADASRDDFLAGAGHEPADLAAALGDADSATRARVVSRLQRERGNAFVQRVAAEARGTPGRLVGLSQPEMVQEVLQRKGSGAPLPDAARAPLEQHFGANLGDVRVHDGDDAAALNREVEAEAFTVGNDVFFAEGKYAPHSVEGRALLAHELTHVGQQTGFGGQAVQRQEEEEEPPPPPSPEEEEQATAG
jgi:hypothetical protein